MIGTSQANEAAWQRLEAASGRTDRRGWIAFRGEQQDPDCARLIASDPAVRAAYDEVVASLIDIAMEAMEWMEKSDQENEWLFEHAPAQVRVAREERRRQREHHIREMRRHRGEMPDDA